MIQAVVTPTIFLESSIDQDEPVIWLRYIMYPFLIVNADMFFVAAPLTFVMMIVLAYQVTLPVLFPLYTLILLIWGNPYQAKLSGSTFLDTIIYYLFGWSANPIT